MEVFQVNEKQYQLLALESVEGEDTIEFVHHQSISDKHSIIPVIAEFAYKTLSREITTIFYSLRITFFDAFDQGIETKVMLKGIVHYTSDEIQCLVNEYFKTTIRDTLCKRLASEYVDIFLTSLRETLTCKGHSRSQEIKELYEDPIGFLCRLESKLANLNIQQLNDVVRVINGNILNPTSSPNVFNLLQTEPNQQSSLNIKKISSGDNVHVVDDRVRCFDMTDYTNLEGGKYYIPKCDVVYIQITLAKKQFLSFIAQNSFYSFKIFEDGIDTFTLVAGIRRDSYRWFSQKRDSSKRPLQYTLLKDNPFGETDPSASKTLVSNVLLNGDDFIFDADKRSPDTLKSNTRRIEIYGIFCPDALKTFVEETKCPFFIRRVVKFGEFIFYYTQCFVLRDYKKKIVSFIPLLGNTKCKPPKPEYSLCELSWCNHACLNIIYHTMFSFYSEVPDELYEDALRAAEKNFINYKYISLAKAFDPIPISQTDGYIMADVILRVAAAMSSINKRGQMPNFASLRTKDNSPLVSSLSIRTLEKISSIDEVEKDYPMSTINEAILTNTPFRAGAHSHANGIEFI